MLSVNMFLPQIYIYRLLFSTHNYCDCISGKGGKLWNLMSKVELQVVSRESCTETIRQSRKGECFQLHESFTCAGTEPGQGVCEVSTGVACVTSDAHPSYPDWVLPCARSLSYLISLDRLEFFYIHNGMRKLR